MKYPYMNKNLYTTHNSTSRIIHYSELPNFANDSTIDIYTDNDVYTDDIIKKLDTKVDTSSVITNVLLDHPMSNKKHIQYMHLQITDQNCRPVNFTRECELVLLIKSI